jgi:RNA polymerase sigma factor (sigma-70 family)
LTPKSLIEPARHAGTALLRSQTDARLVDLTRDGNERAFEAIVGRYRRPLLRYCTRLLSPTRAEDAVQQAFLSAHRAIHAGDAELNLRPWLYRIAHNASLNLLRQNGFDHDQVSEEIDGVETPPQAFERSERLRTVVAAVQDLPDRQRSAIVLQAVEGRSYEEIASELGVSDGAVRQLLNRARNTLREAAAALTPTGLITRVASSGGEATVAERVASALAGAGGGALLAKAGATLVVAGAVAGGAATVGGGDHADRARAQSPRSVAAAPARDIEVSTPRASGSRHVNSVDEEDGRAGGSEGSSGGPRAGGGGPGSGSPDESHHGGRSESRGHSGSDSGDHSGPGSDGHAGSGDHSGSGGDSGSGDHSGSGSDGRSGSGSGDGAGSGSGSDDPVSAPDSSGSGSSGSGSGSSGSGSSGSGSDDPLLTSDDSSGHDRSGSGGSSDDDVLDGSGTSGSRR